MAPKKNFGYSVNPDRQIDFDATDKRLMNYVAEKEPSLNICIFCGSCAATCSAGNFGEMSFRRVSLLLRRGLNRELKQEIARCMFCGKCILVCPRGVNIRNVIINIRKGLELYEF